MNGILISVVMFSSTDGWILGVSNASSTNPDQAANNFVLLYYDGTKWIEVATPNVKSRDGYNISSIFVPAPDDMWVVGSALSTPAHYSLDTLRALAPLPHHT